MNKDFEQAIEKAAAVIWGFPTPKRVGILRHHLGNVFEGMKDTLDVRTGQLHESRKIVAELQAQLDAAREKNESLRQENALLKAGAQEEPCGTFATTGHKQALEAGEEVQ